MEKLTKQETIMVLNANKKKPKYEKVFHSVQKCGNCNFEMFYKAIRCPKCEEVL